MFMLHSNSSTAAGCLKSTFEFIYYLFFLGCAKIYENNDDLFIHFINIILKKITTLFFHSSCKLVEGSAFKICTKKLNKVQSSVIWYLFK